MPVRVVSGEVGARGVAARTVVPSTAQPRWPPFERVAEMIASPRGRFPPHRHEGAEVLTYVTEGSASYEYGAEPPRALSPGSTSLLTAPTGVSHAIVPSKGRTVRWFALVAALPPGRAVTSRLQTAQAVASGVQPDGTVVRRLVGDGSSLVSAAGLDCEAIEFRSTGASFRKVGRDRVAVCYALSGRGRVDTEPVEAGEAALIADAAGVALQGEPGFHVVLGSAPRAGPASAT